MHQPAVTLTAVEMATTGTHQHVHVNNQVLLQLVLPPHQGVELTIIGIQPRVCVNHNLVPVHHHQVDAQQTIIGTPQVAIALHLQHLLALHPPLGVELTIIGTPTAVLADTTPPQPQSALHLRMDVLQVITGTRITVPANLNPHPIVHLHLRDVEQILIGTHTNVNVLQAVQVLRPIALHPHTAAAITIIGIQIRAHANIMRVQLLAAALPPRDVEVDITGTPTTVLVNQVLIAILPLAAVAPAIIGTQARVLVKVTKVISPLTATLRQLGVAPAIIGITTPARVNPIKMRFPPAQVHRVGVGKITFGIQLTVPVDPKTLLQFAPPHPPAAVMAGIGIRLRVSVNRLTTLKLTIQLQTPHLQATPWTDFLTNLRKELFV